MAEPPIPAQPLPAQPPAAEPVLAEPRPAVVYAVPLEPRRTPWPLAVLVGVAGAALGLVFAFIAMAVTSPTGRLPLPKQVVLPALFPLPSIWWSTVGLLAGARAATLVFFGQYPAYGFAIGLFAARGRIGRAAAVVLAVHTAAWAVCHVFSLP